MGKLKLYDPSTSRASIARERSLSYLHLTPKVQIERLLALIKLSITLNGGKPIKQPQKKGVVISKNG